jgi:hypothetical protein
MKTRLPSWEEIDELVAVLPLLSKAGFIPIKKWEGGAQAPDGISMFPLTIYDELVEKFFDAARKECWTDYDYIPEEAGQMLEDHRLVLSAT